MLVPALLVKDELQKKHLEKILDIEYDYVQPHGYVNLELTFRKDTWQGLGLASVKKLKNGYNVLGYIDFTFCNPEYIVSEMCIISYEQSPSAKRILAMDLKNAVYKIFTEWNKRKITWTVLIGNPVEYFYDRIVKICGGRIIGIKKMDGTSVRGKLCDKKMYEITRDEFLKSIVNKKESEFKMEIRKGGA